MSQYLEYNFDGLVGPTHNYAGLAFGNVASLNNRNKVSNPKDAALQGLEKMYSLSNKGVPQAVLPPVARPDYTILDSLGFRKKTKRDSIEAMYKKSPELLANICSASSMWTANAATQSPSPDTLDKKCHFTIANLANKFHRTIEAPRTFKIFKAIFSDPNYFKVHSPLPTHEYLGDEGAANYTRLALEYGQKGLEMFVYGQDVFRSQMKPQKFPARQSLQAQEAIARLHGLDENDLLFIQQDPKTIDLGVFHNDVISVGNLNCFFYHENSFVDEALFLETFKRKWNDRGNFYFVRVAQNDVSVSDCVSSYLFNSQLVEVSGKMILVVPQECRENERVWNYIQNKLLKENHPIKEILVQNVKQSMENGGGPACLRFRAVLSDQEKKSISANVWMNEGLYNQLKKWIKKYYRDRLQLDDFLDEEFLTQLEESFFELEKILNLPKLYLEEKF